MKIRAMIVDDEPLARKRVRLLASEDRLIEIIGESPGGAEAIQLVEQARPDLLFLDVQMPEMDGFELLERIPARCLPIVIFTTAFDKHAVRAFEKHALDYLVKPLQPERFNAAIARAREHLATNEARTAARGLLELLASQNQNRGNQRYLARITVRDSDRVIVIKTTEIDSIESAGNYVSITVGKQSHILRQTLNALESQLDPDRFLRVSRSAIVNLDRIKELQPMFKGEHLILLQNGKQLTMSRALLREVEQALRFR